jgi:hypothetical protein
MIVRTMVSLVLAWLLTFPFGNVTWALHETPQGTVVVELPGQTLEVYNEQLEYRELESTGLGCTSTKGDARDTQYLGIHT